MNSEHTSATETLKEEEEEEEHKWREVILPSLYQSSPNQSSRRSLVSGGEAAISLSLLITAPSPNMRSTGLLFIYVASRIPSTLFMLFQVSVKNEAVYEATQVLMEALAVEALQAAMVKTVARIVEGDVGKAICKEAERVKPAAVVMGTRGRSIIKSVLKGSVSEYCFHHCKSAPVIIVPDIEAGEHQSFLWRKDKLHTSMVV
ncbi:putative rossmann-like alpha/beta/alpha sandwich protein [Helianthus annuus]|nr:putative rossmann-like alpha/beta/alpha sandwich protein [Helianthus annuus]